MGSGWEWKILALLLLFYRTQASGFSSKHSCQHKTDIIKLIAACRERQNREAAQEFYGENLNQFTTSGNTHVSGLLVEGSHASAYQLIQEAQRAIREGMSFENACTRYATSGEEERFQFTSLSQKADIHGLSTIYAACSQLEIGEISEIIETQQGYYLLKITEKDKEQVMAYEEVKNRIRDILATEKLELYLQALRTEYSVRICEPLWNKIQIT